MKKIALFFVLIIFCILPSYADFMPSYTNSFKHMGIGVINFKGEIKIYEKNDENSSPLMILNNDENGMHCKLQSSICDIENVFLAANKTTQDVFISVENDYDEWFEVCFDQRHLSKGFVKKSQNIDFLSWQGVINYYGRKNGLYLFRNVPDKYKKLYSQPDEDSTMTDEFSYAKYIAPWLVQGDWVLVKLTGYDNITKTGWLRWRLESGTIIAFPNLSRF